MSAYMIVDVVVKDEAAYDRYLAEVPPFVHKHGGVYLARGGAFEVLEGDWRPSRLVLFRFPDVAAVHALFADPDYQELKRLRQGATESHIVVVEGL
jgi:uncharacterized protein (DUF1330 family)